MKNRKLLPKSVILLIIFILNCYGTYATGGGKNQEVFESARSDIVIIDSMKQFGPLERPAVTFLHDLHTEALQKQEKNCSSCHLQNKNRLSLEFKNSKGMQKKKLMDLYHSACIGCHKENTTARLSTGPVECGGCHRKMRIPSSRMPMGFDKSLHYRHTQSQNNKCDTCHHEYDINMKKLIYVKGKEVSCRYCHKKNEEKKILPMSTVSHVACINCHRNNSEQKKKNGPVTCYGCHDAENQKKYEKRYEVPRLDRNQPGQVFIKKGIMGKAGQMDRVAFDHQAHEGYNDTCIQCHHKDLNACSSCHTLKGDKEGNGVNLEQAMHKFTKQSSCLGCHQSRKQATECVGCHAFAGNIRTTDTMSCKSCHMYPLAGIDENDPSVFNNPAAAQALNKRVAITRTYADKDIPDKVIISQLQNQYKPVEMPHRKMVHNLMDGMKDNNLARYFHKSEGTICQGCHHNSPASLHPPKCGSCHGKKTVGEKIQLRPGLMGAYHLQCMECHQNMGLKKLSGCTECHAKK